jgi:hypothetical protein
MMRLLVSHHVATASGAEIRRRAAGVELIALPQDRDARLPYAASARVEIAHFSLISSAGSAVRRW